MHNNEWCEETEMKFIKNSYHKISIDRLKINVTAQVDCWCCFPFCYRILIVSILKLNNIKLHLLAYSKPTHKMHNTISHESTRRLQIVQFKLFEWSDVTWKWAKSQNTIYFFDLLLLSFRCFGLLLL